MPRHLTALTFHSLLNQRWHDTSGWWPWPKQIRWTNIHSHVALLCKLQHDVWALGEGGQLFLNKRNVMAYKDKHECHSLWNIRYTFILYLSYVLKGLSFFPFVKNDRLCNVWIETIFLAHHFIMYIICKYYIQLLHILCMKVTFSWQEKLLSFMFFKKYFTRGTRFFFINQ